MDIDTPEKKFKNISYDHSSFDDLVEYLVNHNKSDIHHLSLFLGVYSPNKKKAVEKLGAKLDRDIQYVDTADIVSRIESETMANIDNFFEGFTQSDHILYFKNANKLCGVYVGNSHSRVKYATPEERYFLQKVQAFSGLVILDIEEFRDADKTLRRAAKSVVSFTLPDSNFKRFFWHLKNFSAHGCDLKTTRPDAYDATA
ncbi:hypothetical protein [Fodinibius salinus]|uniref:hypothetical protein n=1 Tax=Fodinibius salinus TaxID=860790 RepID=UPI0011E6DA62|nr:hypothetical protein [Fodinibius salinus]